MISKSVVLKDHKRRIHHFRMKKFFSISLLQNCSQFNPIILNYNPYTGLNNTILFNIDSSSHQMKFYIPPLSFLC